MRKASLIETIHPAAFLLALLFATFLTSTVQADALYDALLRATPQNLPAGVSSPNVSAGTIEEVDRNNGIAGNIQITFQSDPKARVNYLFFASPDNARKYSLKVAEQVTLSGGRRLFLVNLPSADCAEGQQGTICEIVMDQIVVVTFAANVNGGASPLLKMAVDHLASVKNAEATPAESGPPEPAPGSIDPLDPCILLTKSDAETALGGPVRDARRDSTNSCFYGSQSNLGDSVMIQLIDGGPQKLKFDKSRIGKPVPITGIGEDAFAFVSPAGFVQLSFVKQNQYVALMVSKRKDSKLLNTTKALATQVASHLP